MAEGDAGPRQEQRISVPSTMIASRQARLDALWPVSDPTPPLWQISLLWPVSDPATPPTEGLPADGETVGRGFRRGRETRAEQVGRETRAEQVLIAWFMAAASFPRVRPVGPGRSPGRAWLVRRCAADTPPRPASQSRS